MWAAISQLGLDFDSGCDLPAGSMNRRKVIGVNSEFASPEHLP
jgi:hypothetical protein